MGPSVPASFIYMKKWNALVGLLAVAFLASNCKEQCIEIPPLGQGITSNHKVLIEEFTGARCPNCPDGAAEIANLRSLYDTNLIAVSIHAGNFAVPLAESKYDFRTDEGSSIETFLGTPIGYPSAVIDRKQFPGGFGLQAFKTQWAGFIQQELALDPGVSINIDPVFEAATRKLTVNVTILPTKNLPGEHRLSIMLTENHIIDWQINGADHIEDYEHEHVLRAMLTGFDGAVVPETFTAGVAVTKQFSFNVPASWAAENCHIVAFVHHGGAPDKAVLQAEEVPFF